MNIEIVSCPSADSRTAKEDVTIDILESSTLNHIRDVQQALRFFSEMLMDAGFAHDYTKRAYLEEFYNDFKNLKAGDKFKAGKWYPMHVTKERHHLMERAPDDVNLVDVLEYISDCVMAGLARSGEVYDITLPDELLQKAMKNTVDILKNRTVVISQEEADAKDGESDESE